MEGLNGSFRRKIASLEVLTDTIMLECNVSPSSLKALSKAVTIRQAEGSRYQSRPASTATHCRVV